MQNISLPTAAQKTLSSSSYCIGEFLEILSEISFFKAEESLKAEDLNTCNFTTFLQKLVHAYQICKT